MNKFELKDCFGKKCEIIFNDEGILIAYIYFSINPGKIILGFEDGIAVYAPVCEIKEIKLYESK